MYLFATFYVHSWNFLEPNFEVHTYIGTSEGTMTHLRVCLKNLEIAEKYFSMY